MFREGQEVKSGNKGMKSLLYDLLPREEIRMTGIEHLVIFRRDTPYMQRPQLYRPQIIILAQGRKNIYLGEETYTYNPSRYFVQTVPLPVICEAVIEQNEPMLGLVISIDPKVIGEILYEMAPRTPVPHKVSRGVYDAPVTDVIKDSAERLLGTLGNEDDMNILGPIYLKELLYHIIKSDKGEILKALVQNSRGTSQIAHALKEIHDHYTEPLEIPRLAQAAGMSSSAFHSTFKAMTCTSPLQYIKHIRLHKAREIIQTEGEKANTAAARVGYESASQFSREYKRTFGITPSEDRQIVSAF